MKLILGDKEKETRLGIPRRMGLLKKLTNNNSKSCYRSWYLIKIPNAINCEFCELEN